MFVLKGYKDQLGFIPDIWRTIHNFNLREYLHNYLTNSLFPSKYTWKNITNTKLRLFYETTSQQRLEYDVDYKRFKTIHPELKEASIWEVSVDKLSSVAAFTVARLWATPDIDNDEKQCAVCSVFSNDILKHIVSACPAFLREKNIHRTKNNIRNEIGYFLQSTNFESVYCSLLGSKHYAFFNNDDSVYNKFLSSSLKFVT